MSKTQKIIEHIFQGILVIVIIINLISIISVKLIKMEYPYVFGYTYFSVITGSMDPKIKIGDEVIVKVTKDIKENDIISFKQDGGTITHRVIKIEGDKITTKGDSNSGTDTPITFNDVIGKVVLTIPFLGKLKFLLTNYYFLAVLFISYFIYSSYVNKEEKKDDIKQE